MKKTLHIALTLLLALLCWGCVSDMPELPASASGPGINLTVSVPHKGGARAADDPLNEFQVRSLRLYFFAVEGHDDASSPYLMEYAVDGAFEFERSLRIALPDNALHTGGLFGPTADRCMVYAVANVDAAPEARTVNDLKATAVSAQFDVTQRHDAFAMDGTAEITLDRTTRSATGTISLRRAAAKLTLTVNLPDVINVTDTIRDPLTGTEQYVERSFTSMPEYMHVWMANGVKDSRLNVDPAPVEETQLYSHEISVADGVGATFDFNPAQPKYKYTQSLPFYSFPNRWDPFSPHGNSYLTLVVPWTFTDENGTENRVVTYYRLAVQPNRNFIERNTHYDMRVSINRLGGTSVQKPVDMQFDWNYSMEWNVQQLTTDIKEIQYLLLNNNDFDVALNAYTYKMENDTDISIPFNTSHPVEIESVQMSWTDYAGNPPTVHTQTLSTNKASYYNYSSIASYSKMDNFAGIEIDGVNSLVKFRRDLLHVAWENNRGTITDVTAISAYTFTIRLKHSDDKENTPSRHATIVITQIPAICISAEETPTSPITRFLNSYSQNISNNSRTSYYSYTERRTNYYYYHGYPAENADNSNSNVDKASYLGSLHNYTTGSGNYVDNRNTYIITFSKFENSDKEYIIADPRSRTIDNLNVDNFPYYNNTTRPRDAALWTKAATSTDGTNRMMKYYYPADESSEKSRFVAPKIRVASQWGVTYQISRAAAKRRCAAYQENGRPAGRWRLPTIAEVEYIINLSNKKFIPYLFGKSTVEDAKYWCASGGVLVNNVTQEVTLDMTSTSVRSVRCVYDEWFWGSDPIANKTTFTWGDRPRSTSGT